MGVCGRSRPFLLGGLAVALSILSGFLGVEVLWALDPSRALNEYTLASWRDGLPQQTIQDIVQTPDGYIWLATYEGLVRFDGVRFVVFDRDSQPPLRHNAVYDLAVDRDGTLWLATAVAVERRVGTGFETVLETADFGGRAALAVESDEASGVWIAVGNQLVHLVDDAVVTELRGGHDFPDRVVRVLQQTANGDLWAGLEAGSILQIREGRVLQVLEVPDGRSVLSLADAGGGVVWGGTEGGHLYTWSSSAEEQQPVLSDRGLMGQAVRTLLVERDAAGKTVAFVGADGGGLIRFYQGRSERMTRRNGLASEQVRSLLNDSEGNLWLGTNGGGLHALRDLRFANYSVADGLPHDNVRATMEGSDGALWVGTDGGGLVRLERGSVTAHFGVDELGSPLVRSLFEDSDQNLWVGTTAGLSRIDADGGIERFGLGRGLPGEVVLAIGADSSGRLWVGTNQGLAYGDGVGDFEGLEDHPSLRGLNVLTLVSDGDGGLWFGTLNGLYHWRQGELTAYGLEDGLGSFRIFTVNFDLDGNLWVGTDAGLARFGEATGTFRTFGAAEGIEHRSIFSIVDDGRGSLWTSSNRGVQRIAKQDLERLDRGAVASIEVQTFDRSDGLPADQCNGTSQPSGWRAEDGRIWFATVGGAVVVDPANESRNQVAPPVALESYVVDTVERPIEGPVVVGPRARSFEVRYTALGFRSPENLSFRYRLDGFDLDWHEVGNRRTAYYTNLPPGEFTFRVTASNEDGLENPDGARIEVRVEPTWFETKRFKLAAVILLLCAPWLAYLVRTLRSRSNRRRLEREVRLRTEELAEANRRLERQSRLDGLTGVANRRSFDETLEREWKQAVRRGSALALLMIDIDAFKAYNDSFGHLMGDEALIAVARAISRTARRAGDAVARYGGEEFVVVLPETDRSAARALAEQIRAEIVLLDLAHPESGVVPHLTASIGVAWTQPDSTQSPVDLIEMADEALYRAKAQGRNRVAS